MGRMYMPSGIMMIPKPEWYDTHKNAANCPHYPAT